MRRGAGRDRESGAALLVAMIMIFLLSLLGVSSMRSSTLEQRMTVNSILAGDVLQAAESANEAILNDWTVLTGVDGAPGKRLVVDSPLGAGSLFASRAEIAHVGDGNGIGVSLDASLGSNSFDEVRYIVRGDASIDEVRANRRVEQGAIRQAPGGSNAFNP